jgi:phosphate transport system substrate-binding protein
MTKKFTLPALTLTVLLLTGCPSPQSEHQTITIKGSDTLLQVGQRWAEVYMNAHPDVTIQVTGGGTGTGIASLIGGTTDVCQASRPIKDTEKEEVKTKRNVEVVETPVALDALAVYVNKDNSIASLTLEQVGKIFLGEITDWKDVGGKPGKIVLYGRENSSGTYVYFKEHVLANKDFPASYQALPGTGAVVDAVAKDKSAIAYGGIGYAKDIKTLSIAKDKAGPAVEPSMANVLSGMYPISRQLYWYTPGPPQNATKALIDFVLSPDGQKIVSEQGFYPIKGE